MIRKLSILLCIILLSACSKQTRPDLKWIYASDTSINQSHPVVIVHGVFGSHLRDKTTHQAIWPGGVSTLLFSDYRNIALKINPKTLDPEPDNLEAWKIIGTLVGVDFYQNLIDILDKAGGYQRAYIGQKPTPNQRQYYVFFYDWRQDNVKSAQALGHFIEQVRKDYGQPALKVDLVAHSMGGLISRYFLRYGFEDVLNDNQLQPTNAGAAYVRKTILVGTPSFGSVSALQNIITGSKVGFNRIPTEVLLTMPSAYQLLPHPLNRWIITRKGKTLDRDLFDDEIWKRFEWSIFNPEVRKQIRSQFDNEQAADAYLKTLEGYFSKHLLRARRFVWSLSVPLHGNYQKLYLFGGDCRPTPARILVEEVNGESMIRLHPNEISNPAPGINYNQMMLEPGDGSVTKASLLGKSERDPGKPRDTYSFFPLEHAIMFCDEHSQLTGNINFQDNLLNILLER
ncbi:MAG: lipase/acyltransferase domain-containing protein [bacterium]